MPISLACPSCGRQYSVKDDAAGKRFKCKDCAEVIEVPGDGGDVAEDDYGEPYKPLAADAGGMPAPAPARRNSGRSGGADSAAAIARLKLPAIILIVICGLSIIGSLVDLGFRVINSQNGEVPPFVNPQQAEFFQVGNVGGMVFNVFTVLLDSFLIFAATRMMAGRSYPLAYACAVISVIPCLSPCCVVGIPFGVWALVVLNDPSVKAAFR